MFNWKIPTKWKLRGIPAVSLSPNMPHIDEGMRTDPPKSLPRPNNEAELEIKADSPPNKNHTSKLKRN